MTKGFHRIALASLLASAAMPIAFENKGGWKKKEDGSLELDDKGNPIFVLTDGSERSVEGDTIGRLNAEAKTNRERAERAEQSLKPFEGLDPKKARDAISTLEKIDQKTLIDAGEVDRVRNQISEQYTGQLAEKDKTIGDLTGERDGLVRDKAFATSKFIAEKIAVPPEMFTATFGNRFKVEGGKMVPVGADGQPLMSKKRLGEVADLDEALEIIVDAYPHKDSILKAPDASGTGNGGGGGTRGNGRYMKRSEFDTLAPGPKAEAAGLMAKGELTVTD